MSSWMHFNKNWINCKFYSQGIVCMSPPCQFYNTGFIHSKPKLYIIWQIISDSFSKLNYKCWLDSFNVFSKLNSPNKVQPRNKSLKLDLGNKGYINRIIFLRSNDEIIIYLEIKTISNFFVN